MEKPNKYLIEKRVTQNLIQSNQKFRDSIGTLEDIFSYGTNLLVRCLHQKVQTGIKKDILLSCFLKQNLYHLDSFIEQCRLGQIHSCVLQLRTILEISFYVEYILHDESLASDICTLFYVSGLRDEKKLFECSQTYFPDDQIGIERIQQIDKILNQPEYQKANKEFAKKNRKWYQVNDNSNANLRQLAKFLQREEEYLFTAILVAVLMVPICLAIFVVMKMGTH